MRYCGNEESFEQGEDLSSVSPGTAIKVDNAGAKVATAATDQVVGFLLTLPNGGGVGLPVTLITSGIVEGIAHGAIANAGVPLTANANGRLSVAAGAGGALARCGIAVEPAGAAGAQFLIRVI